MSVRLVMAALGVVLAGAALAADKVAPGDWPQWRGPNRDGKSTEKGLLQVWPKDGPPKLWTAEGLGVGFGTPSVAAGKIFGMGSRGNKDGVWAINEADGKELWFTPLDDNRNPNQMIGSGCAPTYADGKLYVVTNKNGVVAKLDATTGKVDWQKSYVKDFGAGTPSWGFNDSVLIDGDKVICAPCGKKGAVAALKVQDGSVIWATTEKPGGGAGYSSPVKAVVDGVPMYVVLLGKGTGVVGVHADTGKLLWNYAKVTSGVAAIPTVIVQGNSVWCSCGYPDGGSGLVKLTAKGKGEFTAEEVVYYSSKELQNQHGGMILLDGYVYFGNRHGQGHPACVDLKTGDVMWKEKQGAAGGGGSAAITFADGRLYYRYQNGVMVLMEPNPKGMKVVSSFKLPPPNDPKKYSQSWPHPVIANGKLYIRDQNLLHCFNVKGKSI
ncbi:MAG TPA: PQQ-binding-like beta-propeller repeat protein [Gemmataceae bacterium]